jgi:RNA polymerase sigma-70 factor, ECF subfamily
MPADDSAFEAVYAQHLGAVSAYLARRTESRFVEDLAADVFAVAWRKRASVTPGEELPWLYRIAANLLANHRRREARGTAIFAALREPDSAPSAEDIVVADAALGAAWRQLRVRDREVLALAVFEDLAVNEVARALDISANAASIRLHRARKALAGHLAENSDSALKDQ